MSDFLNSLREETNFGYTENGALTHRSTLSGVMDLFAMGAAYRQRSDADCIVLFKKAFAENPTYALKCLFYLRDVRGGQGERRFFRTCMKHLVKYNIEAVRRNFKYFPVYGRWDDLYILVDTPLENEVFDFMKHQLALDVECKTPSLLAKWLKSENTSSAESCRLAKITRQHFGMTAKQYRKTLSLLRERIKVVERLMSAQRWSEIEFDKIPSKAGMIYRNAFARHDIERMLDGAVQSYEDFAKSEAKVNADALYPYEVVKQARFCHAQPDTIERLMINKYWDNLTDYFKDKTLNALCVVDTSGSMCCGANSAAPIDVAISLGLYCAERANGPFAGHYISFASRPQLIKTEGIDFVDKVQRIYRTNLIDNTNIEAVFDLLLETAMKHRTPQSDLPESIVIISDMEFDYARNGSWNSKETLMEGIKRKWERAGYHMPNLVFWNVNARNDNIPMRVESGISFVSGFSPVLFEQIMSGKTAEDLVMDKLTSERYAPIN